MATTAERIRDLADAKVVSVTEKLFERVFAEIPFEDVRTNFEGVDAVRPLLEFVCQKRSNFSPAQRHEHRVLGICRLDDGSVPMPRTHQSTDTGECPQCLLRCPIVGAQNQAIRINHHRQRAGSHRREIPNGSDRDEAVVHGESHLIGIDETPH